MTHLPSLPKQWYVDIFSNVLGNNGILVCVFSDAWVDVRRWVQMPPPFFLQNPSVLPSLLARVEYALRMMRLEACQYWCRWSVFPSPKVSPSLLKENQPTPALKNSLFWSPLTITFCSKKKLLAPIRQNGTLLHANSLLTDPFKMALSHTVKTFLSSQNGNQVIPKRNSAAARCSLKKSFNSSLVILQKEKSSSLTLSKTSFYWSLLKKPTLSHCPTLLSCRTEASSLFSCTFIPFIAHLSIIVFSITLKIFFFILNTTLPVVHIHATLSLFYAKSLW